MYKFIFIIEREKPSIFDDHSNSQVMVSGQSIKWPEGELYQADIINGLEEFFPESPEAEELQPLKRRVSVLYRWLDLRLRFADNADGIFCLNSEQDFTIIEVEDILNGMPIERLCEFLLEAKV